MIKGLGYLKYLKQSLIGFGISSFMVLGGSFANAELVEIGQSSQIGDNTCTIYSDLSISCDSSDHALAYEYTTTYNKFMDSIFWSNDGIGIVNNRIVYKGNSSGSTEGSYQGLLVDGFHICSGDVISYINTPSYANGTFFPGCNAGFTKVGNYTYEQLKNKLLSKTPLYRYNPTNGNGTAPAIGLLYDDFYFVVWVNPAWSDSASVNNGNFVSQDLGINGYNLNSVNWSNSNILRSPTGNGLNIEGGSYTGNYNGITGDTVSLGCTKKQALEWYRCNGYKSRMCYSSFNNNDELYTAPGEAVGYALTGVDIEDVRFNTAWYRRGGITGDSMDYNVWFSYWRNIFDVYKKNENITNPFIGVPVSIFTLMGNVNSYGLPYSNESILEFCDLSLYTADYNANYTGIASSVVCNMTPIEITDCHISNLNNPDGGLPGDLYTDGTVSAIGSSWVGITNRSGFNNKPGGRNLNLIGDGKTFENNFFTLLKDSFKYPETTGIGFIPGYILIALCGLVLFRFLSH